MPQLLFQLLPYGEVKLRNFILEQTPSSIPRTQELNMKYHRTKKKEPTSTLQPQHQGTFQCFVQHFDCISRQNHPPCNVSVQEQVMEHDISLGEQITSSI